MNAERGVRAAVVVAGLLGALALTLPRPACATPAALAQATPIPTPATGRPAAGGVRQREMAARKAFAAGQWSEALDLFAGLYAETLHPVYLRNIGRCHQKLRDPDRAIDAFRDYLAKSKSVARDERAEIDGYIREMEALRAERAAAAPAAAAALVAPPGDPAASTSPGASPRTGPEEEVEAPGLGPRLAPPAPTLALGPPPASAADPPIYKRWWFWTAAAAVVAGTVTAVVLARSSADDDCPAGVLACK